MAAHPSKRATLALLALTGALPIASAADEPAQYVPTQKLLREVVAAAAKFDTCNERGLIPGSAVYAEEQVKALLKRLEEYNKPGYDSAMKRWAIAKEQTATQPQSWWQNNCPRIAGRWEFYKERIEKAKK